MAVDFFAWNGSSTLDFGLRIERYPVLSSPRRKHEKINVPGRSGDLLVAQDAFENTPAVYEMYFNAKHRKGTAEHSRAIAAWLLSAPGYLRLEDTYDPARYRMAAFLGALDIENAMNQYGRGKVEFDCKPQRYRKDGEHLIPFAQRGILMNPERFASLPIVNVYGSGAGTLTIGGTSVTLLALDQSVTLDSETQNAYKGTLNKNGTIRAPKFPQLLPGENEISFTGGVSRVEIIPRWWTL